MNNLAVVKLGLAESAEMTADRFFVAVRNELMRPLPYDEWEALGDVLVKAHRVLDRQRNQALMALGDWLVYGRKATTDPRLAPEARALYEDRYSQAASLSGYEPGYLYNIATTMWRWPPERRADAAGDYWPNLSLGHFQAVSAVDKLDPEKAEQLLNAAELARWTRSQLREAAGLMKQIVKDPDGAAPLPAGFNFLPVENGQETAPYTIFELAELLRSLFLEYAPPGAARALALMPEHVWEQVAEQLLTDINQERL